MTDKLSKGTLQRPKHANSGDKPKGSNTDGQHEEAGIIAKLCVGTRQWLAGLMLKSLILFASQISRWAFVKYLYVLIF